MRAPVISERTLADGSTVAIGGMVGSFAANVDSSASSASRRAATAKGLAQGRLPRAVRRAKRHLQRADRGRSFDDRLALAPEPRQLLERERALQRLRAARASR